MFVSRKIMLLSGPKANTKNAQPNNCIQPVRNLPKITSFLPNKTPIFAKSYIHYPNSWNSIFKAECPFLILKYWGSRYKLSHNNKHFDNKNWNNWMRVWSLAAFKKKGVFWTDWCIPALTWLLKVGQDQSFNNVHYITVLDGAITYLEGQTITLLQLLFYTSWVFFVY